KAKTVGVDCRQRDEQEAVAQLTQLGPAQRVGVDVPLEGARPVEREARLGEPFVDLVSKGLGWSSVRIRELAPDQVGDAAVEVAAGARDGEGQAASRFGGMDGGHGGGAGAEWKLRGGQGGGAGA